MHCCAAARRWADSHAVPPRCPRSHVPNSAPVARARYRYSSALAKGARVKPSVIALFDNSIPYRFLFNGRSLFFFSSTLCLKRERLNATQVGKESESFARRLADGYVEADQSRGCEPHLLMARSPQPNFSYFPPFSFFFL